MLQLHSTPVALRRELLLSPDSSPLSQDLAHFKRSLQQEYKRVLREASQLGKHQLYGATQYASPFKMATGELGLIIDEYHDLGLFQLKQDGRLALLDQDAYTGRNALCLDVSATCAYIGTSDGLLNRLDIASCAVSSFTCRNRPATAIRTVCLTDREVVSFISGGTHVASIDCRAKRTSRIAAVASGAVCMAAHGFHVAVGSEDGTCSIVDSRTLQPITKLASEASIASVAWSPCDGRQLITAEGGSMGKVTMWDPSTGYATHEFYASGLTSASFTSKGQILTTHTGIAHPGAFVRDPTTFAPLVAMGAGQGSFYATQGAWEIVLTAHEGDYVATWEMPFGEPPQKKALVRWEDRHGMLSTLTIR